MVNENWAPAPGYEELYEVSDLGRVKSLRLGKLMKPHEVNYRIGYLQVGFSLAGRMKNFYVHRLVLEAFVGPCPDGMECRHLNGNARDNRLLNLAWGTRSENNFDRVKHGTHYHTARTHCPKGHPLDGVARRPDGTIRQRICITCRREKGRRRRAAKQTCPQGHPFDAVAYKSDGTVRQRYCTRCRVESVSKQMTARHGEARANRTHCAKGHELDGVCARGRYCKRCNNERNRAARL